MLIQFKRFQSKLLPLLGLSLALIIAGCGGGDSASDPSDIYVGTWKSKCYLYSTGVYTQRIRYVTKSSATQMVSNIPNTNAYSDASCSVLVGTGTLSHVSGTFNLGAKTTFQGQSVDSYTYVSVSGTNYSGYMTVNGSNLFVAFTTTAVLPTDWSVESPYTKQ